MNASMEASVACTHQNFMPRQNNKIGLRNELPINIGSSLFYKTIK